MKNVTVKKCVICGKEFEAKRSDAEACSSICRQKNWRNRKEQKLILSPQPICNAEVVLRDSDNGSLTQKDVNEMIDNFKKSPQKTAVKAFGEKGEEVPKDFIFPDDLDKITPEVNSEAVNKTIIPPEVLKGYFDAGSINNKVERLKTLEEIEDFYNMQNITPKDLMDRYFCKKKPETKKITEIGVEKQSDSANHLSKYQQELRDKKLGIKS